MVNNYKKEEEVQDTPETLVQNHEAQLAALDGLPAKTAETINRVEQNLGWLLSQLAVQADPNAQNAIQYVWEDSQAIANQVVQMDAARLAAAAFTKKMWGYHKKLAGDYEELQRDIVEMNSENRLISDLIENVEQNTYKWIDQSDYFDDAYSEATDNLFTEIFESLRNLTGVNDVNATEALVDVLTGTSTPSESQIDLLRKLLTSFVKPGNHNDTR